MPREAFGNMLFSCNPPSTMISHKGFWWGTGWPEMGIRARVSDVKSAEKKGTRVSLMHACIQFGLRLEGAKAVQKRCCSLLNSQGKTLHFRNKMMFEMASSSE